MKQYFKFGGLSGYLIAVVGLVATAVILQWTAIKVQQNEAVNYYSIDTSLHGLKANGNDMNKFYKLEGK